MKPGTVQNYRYVGYIRTNCFSKVIGMVKPEAVTVIGLERAVQRSVQREDYKSFVTLERTTYESFVVDWDSRKNPGLFPSEKMQKMMAKAELGDFVTKRLQFCFKSESLAKYLNDEIRTQTQRSKPVYLPVPCQFFATFINNWSDELKKLPFLQKLNREEVSQLGFKISCLDLIDLHTERMEKYGERENIPVGDTFIIKAVFKALDWDGWPVHKRTVEIDGLHHTPNPVAIRQYIIKDSRGWILAGETEVD